MKGHAAKAATRTRLMPVLVIAAALQWLIAHGNQ
jgi:hypothetical protein